MDKEIVFKLILDLTLALMEVNALLGIPDNDSPEVIRIRAVIRESKAKIQAFTLLFA